MKGIGSLLLPVRFAALIPGLTSISRIIISKPERCGWNMRESAFLIWAVAILVSGTQLRVLLGFALKAVGFGQDDYEFSLFSSGQDLFPGLFEFPMTAMMVLVMAAIGTILPATPLGQKLSPSHVLEYIRPHICRTAAVLLILLLTRNVATIILQYLFGYAIAHFLAACVSVIANISLVICCANMLTYLYRLSIVLHLQQSTDLEGLNDEP